MNVEIGTEAPIFLFWEYLFQIFGILSLQCGAEGTDPKLSPISICFHWWKITTFFNAYRSLHRTRAGQPSTRAVGRPSSGRPTASYSSSIPRVPPRPGSWMPYTRYRQFSCLFIVSGADPNSPIFRLWIQASTVAASGIGSRPMLFTVTLIHLLQFE